MDTWEVTKVVFERVQALDRENAAKIVGMILIQENSDKDLIRLAFGPDHLLNSVVAKARAELTTKLSSSSSSVLGPLQMGRPWGMTDPGGEQMGCNPLYPDKYDVWSPVNYRHRRSFSPSGTEVVAWKPCMHYARGFCKYGSSCRFLHVLPQDDATIKSMAMQPPRLMEAAFPFSPSPKGLNCMFSQQQQLLQSEPQRSAAAAMLLGAEDLSRLSVRSPRMDRMDPLSPMNSPATLQIYLTFPAVSTFTEKDVFDYFMTFGPVQDVRIPQQKKRMYGFVTFVYPESVKIILCKGNPHFVCGARVLVKPYKEKGKIHDRKIQQPNHGEFPGCIAPSRLINPNDPFDLQQPQIGPRMLPGDFANQDVFLRRKLEEQQQAVEFQQAIEPQNRHFMGLHPLEFKKRVHHLGSPAGSPMSLGKANGEGNINGSNNVVSFKNTIQGAGNKMNSSSTAMGASTFSAFSETATKGKHEEQRKEEGTTKQAVNPMTVAPIVSYGFQESVVDHNLPESLLSSPTKAKTSFDCTSVTAQNDNISPHHVASSLFPSTSSLELPPYNSCLFQGPRFTSGHEARKSY